MIGVAPAPHIAPGSGRVVLATYAHHDEIVSIHFDGAADPVDSSPWHRFYSRDRIEWIDARNLRVGERIRTKSGISTITSIDHKPGAARVFDLEVEGDHAYYVADEQVLTHNCGEGGAGGRFVDANGQLRNANGTFAGGAGDSAAAARGRQAHLNYRNTLGEGYDFEQTIKPGKGGYRADAIDYEKRIVRELKPDTPKTVSAGRRQVNRYKAYLEQKTGQPWTAYVDLYKP